MKFEIEDPEEFIKEMMGSFEDSQKTKVENFRQLNQYAKKGQIVFTGSSLMEQFPICEYCASEGIQKIVYNRGIGGYTTDDFINSIDVMVFELEPSKIFINIGTNDMSEREDGEDWQEHLLKNYEYILTQIKERLPETEVYLMAYYPVNEHLPEEKVAFGTSFMLKVRTLKNIEMVNGKIETMAQKFGYHFIDVNDGLTDEKGDLKANYTLEGIHMYSDAYHVVFENLKKYI